MARTKNVFISYCRGAGSILEIVPPSRYRNFVPQETFNQRLRGNFMCVGDALRHSMDVWQREPQEVTRRKAGNKAHLK